MRRSAQLGILDGNQLPAMTHYEPEGDEPNLLQCARERLPSRGMSLLAGECDDDATEPAVHQIECIVWYIKQANEGVILASHEYQRDHVDECKSTRSISKMLQLGGQWPVPLDTVSAKDDVHRDDSRK